MKKIILALTLLLSFNSIQAGVRVGGADHAITIGDKTYLRDFISKAKCLWKTGEYILKNEITEKWNPVIISILQADDHFSSIIQDEFKKLMICETEADLREIKIQNENEVLIHEFAISQENVDQAAIRDGDIIFINTIEKEKLLKTQSDADVYLYIHETLHSFLPMYSDPASQTPYPLRQSKIEGMTHSIKMLAEGKMDPELFRLQMIGNDFLERPYSKSLKSDYLSNNESPFQSILEHDMVVDRKIAPIVEETITNLESLIKKLKGTKQAKTLTAIKESFVKSQFFSADLTSFECSSLKLGYSKKTTYRESQITEVVICDSSYDDLSQTQLEAMLIMLAVKQNQRLIEDLHENSECSSEYAAKLYTESLGRYYRKFSNGPTSCDL